MAPRKLIFATFLVFLSVFHLAQSTRLTRLRDCRALLRYLRTNGLSRVGPYGLFPFQPIRFSRFPPSIQPDAAPNFAPSGDTEPVAGVDFSETNVQVEGVDEPDIVKTDGKHVYVLRRDVFSVVSVSSSGASGKVSGSLKLPLIGSEMLFEGNTILVIARNTTFNRFKEPIFPTPFIRPFPVFIPPKLSTVLFKINVSKAVPKLVATLRIDGSYFKAREVNGIARIIVKSTLGERLNFQFPGKNFSNEQAVEQNKRVVSKSNLGDWLPRYELKENKCRTSNSACISTSEGVVSGCNAIYFTKGTFTGFSLLTVLTVPLRGNFIPRKSSSIISDGNEIYSSATSMYVTTNEYRYDFPFNSIRWGPSFKTTLHKFKLSASGARYVASGDVTGSVLNQFSMHEYKGVFYVATTEGARWWSLRNLSKSKVTSFKMSGRDLKKIGEVGNLGVGERIFSVRYVQSTAYVVTFRQIDPLYVIDISNPRNLIVTGELKIPGFSSYLHLIAPGRILGVGREATPEGRTTGAKVTLFDVSNVKKPRELAGWTLEGSYSTAEFDHRAFLYWEPESIAVLPISVYARDAKDRFTGSVVLNISDRAIKERGRISHSGCCETSATFSRIERNFVLGRIHLWSLSSKLLQVNDIKTMKTESSIPL